VGYIGLFGYVGYSIIENIELIGSFIKGQDCVGGLVGFHGNGIITNCYCSGTVSGTTYVGGVAGSNRYYITNCYNTSAVNGTSYVGGVAGENVDGSYIENCYNKGAVNGTDRVGGVAGRNSNGVLNCYNSGSLSGISDVGGLIGWNYEGKTNNCYNTGVVSGTTNVGGLVGWNNLGTINYCYWNTTIYATGVGYNTGTDNSTGKTKMEMQSADFVTLLNANKSFSTLMSVFWVSVSGGYPTFGNTITYYLEGGTNNINNAAIYFYGVRLTLSNPTQTGCSFGGWYDNAGYTGTAVTAINPTTTGAVKLYAQWTANIYNITYHLDGGTNSAENATNYTYYVGSTLSNPTKTGFTFEGWYDNASFTGEVVTVISSTTSGDITLYAKWVATAYTITASAGNNGSITPSGEISVNEGSSQTYTITANKGYHITNVLVDGASVGTVNSYTFSNVVATHTITASFELTTGTAVAQSTDNSIKLYPNPVINKLTVELDDQSLQYQVRIYSLKGDLKYNEFGKNSQFEIDMSNYSTGVYFIQVISPKGIKTTKIIKN
jgi:uncharacterized repeat protein (TIGR02543 family)